MGALSWLNLEREPTLLFGRLVLWPWAFFCETVINFVGRTTEITVVYTQLNFAFVTNLCYAHDGSLSLDISCKRLSNCREHRHTYKTVASLLLTAVFFMFHNNYYRITQIKVPSHTIYCSIDSHRKLYLLNKTQNLNAIYII